MIDLTQTSIVSLNEVTTDEEEVLRNAKVILSTVKGQVALDREFGVDPDLLDMPMPDAESFFFVQSIQLLQLYEPRALIQDVTFDNDGNGKFVPKAVIEIVR